MRAADAQRYLASLEIEITRRADKDELRVVADL